MRVVLDTNILVSGLLKPFSPAGAILRLVARGALEVCHDARILTEYAEVLARPRFAFDATRVRALLEQVRAVGPVVAPPPLAKELPDRDAEAFLEVALAAAADCLVTGNARHFPSSRRQGMTVLSPRAFVEAYRGTPP